MVKEDPTIEVEHAISFESDAILIKVRKILPDGTKRGIIIALSEDILDTIPEGAIYRTTRIRG